MCTTSNRLSTPMLIIAAMIAMMCHSCDIPCPQECMDEHVLACSEGPNSSYFAFTDELSILWCDSEDVNCSVCALFTPSDFFELIDWMVGSDQLSGQEGVQIKTDFMTSYIDYSQE